VRHRTTAVEDATTTARAMRCASAPGRGAFWGVLLIALGWFRFQASLTPPQQSGGCGRGSALAVAPVFLPAHHLALFFMPCRCRFAA